MSIKPATFEKSKNVRFSFNFQKLLLPQRYKKKHHVHYTNFGTWIYSVCDNHDNSDDRSLENIIVRNRSRPLEILSCRSTI